LKWVPKTVLGFGVRSRVAGMLASVTGISKDILLGTGEGADAPEEKDASESIKTSGNTLAKAGKKLSDTTKQVESAASGFGKSSPGVWVYLKKASTNMTKNIKRIVFWSSILVGTIVSGLTKVIKNVHSGMGRLLGTVMRTIASGVSRTVKYLAWGMKKIVFGVVRSINDAVKTIHALLTSTLAKTIGSISSKLFGGNKDKSTQSADILSTSLSKSGKMMMSAGRRLIVQTRILMRALQFALTPGFGFIKGLTGLIKDRKPKMPMPTESWQRRATQETTIKASKDQQPIPVKVIGPIQLKEDPRTAMGPLKELATNSAHLATLPTLLSEFQQLEVNGRRTILGTLEAIEKNTQVRANMFLGGGAQPGGVGSGPNRLRMINH
jgi:hypothetical protein